MPEQVYKSFDIDSWKRASIFEFFSSYDHPWFNLCVQVPVEALIRWSKEKEERSFFLALLYLSQTAAEATLPFRLRIAEEGVRLYEHLNTGCTVMRDNETFSFAYFEQATDFAEFQRLGKEVVKRVRQEDLPLRPDDDLGIIHYSMLPWLSFTSMSHPRRHDAGDSVPKICMGKYHGNLGKRVIPVSIEVHHALMDGNHASMYFKKLEESFASPEKYLKD